MGLYYGEEIQENLDDQIVDVVVFMVLEHLESLEETHLLLKIVINWIWLAIAS